MEGQAARVHPANVGQRGKLRACGAVAGARFLGVVTNEPLPPRVVAEIAFLARGGGAVKALRGFRKGHHVVPEAVTPVTSAFLARLCAEE